MAGGKSFARTVFSWDAAALVQRLVLALVFIHHGGQKVFGWWDGPGWSATISQFDVGFGIPRPLTIVTMVTEFVGGICIALGLLTRFWSAGLVILLIVAIVQVHLNDYGQIELHLGLIALALGLFLGGPGHWALADLEGSLLGLHRPAKM